MTPYEVLGVSRTASTDEIKRAFRKAAMRCHPDLAQTDPLAAQRFQELTRAYEALSTPEARAAYDRMGATVERATDFGDAGEKCGLCRGTGAERGARWAPCETCDGEREIVTVTTSGFFQRLEECGDCLGRGSVPLDPCPRCGGVGSSPVRARPQTKALPGAARRLKG